jgi:hypothetical protein
LAHDLDLFALLLKVLLIDAYRVDPKSNGFLAFTSVAEEGFEVGSDGKIRLIQEFDDHGGCVITPGVRQCFKLFPYIVFETPTRGGGKMKFSSYSSRKLVGRV